MRLMELQNENQNTGGIAVIHAYESKMNRPTGMKQDETTRAVQLNSYRSNLSKYGALLSSKIHLATRYQYRGSSSFILTQSFSYVIVYTHSILTGEDYSRTT